MYSFLSWFLMHISYFKKCVFFLSCILPLRSICDICPENQLSALICTILFLSKQEPPLFAVDMTSDEIRKEVDLFPSILRIKQTWLSKIHWICLLSWTAGWYLVFLLGHSGKSRGSINVKLMWNTATFESLYH